MRNLRFKSGQTLGRRFRTTDNRLKNLLPEVTSASKYGAEAAETPDIIMRIINFGRYFIFPTAIENIQLRATAFEDILTERQNQLV